MSTILIVSNGFVAERNFRREIVQSLLNRKFCVIISAPDKEASVFFQQMGCQVVHSDFNRRGTNPIKDIQLCWAYIRLIKKYQPDVVLSFTIKPNIYAGLACRLTRTKQIANITGFGDAVERGGMLNSLLFIMMKVGLRKASRVVFQNASNLDTLLRKHIVRQSQTKLLPGSGVNLEYHSIQPYPQDTCIKFLYIGRIMKDKGIIELLNAAKIIKKKFADKVEILVLGKMEENYQSRMNEYINEGIVSYLGYTSDVRSYLRNASCLVLPSYHEGLSNVCLEASATARPVITTDVPGCREIIDDNLSGFLVKPKDADDLAQKMSKFANLPFETRKEMGFAARRKVESEFDRKIVVDYYIREIQKMIQ